VVWPAWNSMTFIPHFSAATNYLDSGLNAVIDGDDGTRLEAEEIRTKNKP